MNISVVGIGTVSAIGIGIADTLQSIKNGRSGIGSMRYLKSVHTELPVGEVKLSDEELKQRLGVDSSRIVSRTSLLGALALREAIQGVCLDGKRVCLLSGTTVGGMDVTEKYFSATPDSSFQQQLIEHISKHDCGSQTEDMAEIAGLKDIEICTISTACSAALNSIITGCEMLKANEADIVIAGGTEALSRFHLNGFNSLMILDHEPCRPFCKRRQGLNLGEGAAFLVLQRQEQPGKTVSPPCLQPYCSGIIISGYGNRCDAFHQTASSPEGEGAFLAMTDALAMAGLRPADIDYVNAHGTGTTDNDRSESHALMRIFAEHKPVVSSTKSLTGHTTSASGAIETVICILAMQESIIPPNVAWKEKDPDCIMPQTTPTNEVLNHVMCNAFGFGGNDSSLIITKAKTETRTKAKTEAKPNNKTNPEAKGTAVKTLSEAVVTDPSQLSELSDLQLIPQREMRRMGKLMKAATLTSLKALREAGVEKPDAIITATKYGMLENSERFLTEMAGNGEQMLSPTLFMQSTHNTIGSAIGIRLGCHGYNTTYTQGEKSLDWALRDARRLIASGRAKTVLIGVHDESTPLFRSLMLQCGKTVPPEVYSKSMIVGREGLKK
ncbi:MAG: beta-ketoacyl-[Prevotella sp.]|nr:beta-ketoacyl-[acyl-carrier-protein] synthase family protein [Prevotella sp.]